MGFFDDESKFESSVKFVPYSQQAVYDNISDLRNLEKVRDRVPEDKVNDFSFDQDTVSLNVQPVGELKLRICDREEPKCVKFETVESPVPFNVWVQVLPVDENNSKMKVTVKAELNPFIKKMVEKPLQDGVLKGVKMKLWEKNFEINKEIERFTVGRDREMDLYLAKYDVLGSMAHITMLESIGLLEKDELSQLLAELKAIYELCERGEFVIEDDVEDVHSQVEMLLTRRLGDMGKTLPAMS